MYSFSPNVKYFSFVEEPVVENKETLRLQRCDIYRYVKFPLILRYQENPEHPNNQRFREVLRPMRSFTSPGEIDLDKRFVYTIPII